MIYIFSNNFYNDFMGIATSYTNHNRIFEGLFIPYNIEQYKSHATIRCIDTNFQLYMFQILVGQDDKRINKIKKMCENYEKSLKILSSFKEFDTLKLRYRIGVVVSKKLYKKERHLWYHHIISMNYIKGNREDNPLGILLD